MNRKSLRGLSFATCGRVIRRLTQPSSRHATRACPSKSAGRSRDTRHPTPDTRHGFTLLEIILAMVILSVSVAALVGSSSKCIAVARKAMDFETARRVLAQGELEFPLIVATNDLEQLEVEGELYEGDYEFSRKIEELEEDEDLFIVRTTVSWPRRNGRSQLEVLSYVYTTNHP